MKVEKRDSQLAQAFSLSVLPGHHDAPLCPHDGLTPLKI
jgi:hypothetical protein